MPFTSCKRKLIRWVCAVFSEKYYLICLVRLRAPRSWQLFKRLLVFYRDFCKKTYWYATQDRLKMLQKIRWRSLKNLIVLVSKLWATQSCRMSRLLWGRYWTTMFCATDLSFLTHVKLEANRKQSLTLRKSKSKTTSGVKIDQPNSASNSEVLLANESGNTCSELSSPLQSNAAQSSHATSSSAAESNVKWRNFTMSSIVVAIVVSVVATRWE